MPAVIYKNNGEINVWSFLVNECMFRINMGWVYMCVYINIYFDIYFKNIIIPKGIFESHLYINDWFSDFRIRFDHIIAESYRSQKLSNFSERQLKTYEEFIVL